MRKGVFETGKYGRHREPQVHSLFKLASRTFIFTMIGKLILKIAVTRLAAKIFDLPEFRTWLKESDDRAAADFRANHALLLGAAAPVLLNQLDFSEVLTLLATYLAAARAKRSATTSEV